MTAVDIQRQMHRMKLPKISLLTIRRILKSEGLNGRIRVKKPLLTKRHKKLRLKFAKKYRHWTSSDWRKVIFSDETQIRRIGSSGKLYCWRFVKEPVSERTSKPTVKKDGGDFMIWSCFGYNGVGWAAKINGGINAELYKEVLEGEFLWSIEHCLQKRDQQNMVFQQDNAPCHKARSIMSWFDDNGIQLLDDPPQSPDLNPIENLWRILKHKLHQDGTINTAEKLWNQFEKEWENISGDICKKLIDSMPKRLAAVIKAKGGPTKY